MPYITDAGARPWSDVINETGNGIRGAIGRYQGRVAADEEANRALHPATAKWMQKVLTGEMTPVDAARAAHDEIDNTPVSAPPVVSPNAPVQAGRLDLGSASGPGSTGETVTPGSGQVPIGIRHAVSTPVAASPQPMQPFTSRDVGDLERLAPFASATKKVGSGLSVDDRIKIDNNRSDNRNETQAQNNDSKEMIAHNRLMFDYDRLLSQEEMKMKQMDSLMERARLGSATSIEIQKAKIIQSEINARISAKAKDTSSIMNDSSASTTSVREHEQQILQLAQERSRQLGIPGPRIGIEGGPQGPILNPAGEGMKAPAPVAPPVSVSKTVKTSTQVATKGNPSGTPDIPKKLVAKYQNKNANKTKMVYSDGSEEIVNGLQ